MRAAGMMMSGHGITRKDTEIKNIYPSHQIDDAQEYTSGSG